MKPSKLLFLSSLCLVVLAAGCREKPAPPVAGPPQVVVAPVEKRDVEIVREWTGRLDGSVNIDVRARVSGYIDKIEIKEGRLVKAGDLLLRIDPRPLQATLAQAKAEVTKAIATQGKMEADEKRQTQLYQNRVISEQEYNNTVQANLASKASVESARAAQLQAQINLDYAVITSPIDGIVGRTDFSIGDYVAAGNTGTPVTTVSTVDPIKVVFAISEKEYLETSDKISQLLTTPTSLISPTKNIVLVRADGKHHTEKGSIVAVDREVDAKTGTIRITAYFANPGCILRPGQYGRVRIVSEDEGKGVVVIPQRAVAELQGKTFVWVVDASNKVTQRQVVTGARVGSDWVIESGLAPSERIIVDGLQKVRDGIVVTPAQPAQK